MVSCMMDGAREDDVISAAEIKIGWPTDFRHVAHVTFDRFNGYLGLPVEFEEEIPGRVPSASASVFGVSAESIQCCYDSRGNSVPTILLHMQEKLLYMQHKAEGIFRINPENSQEEHVREQLNWEIVPDDMDVHCLAGLIKVQASLVSRQNLYNAVMIPEAIVCQQSSCTSRKIIYARGDSRQEGFFLINPENGQEEHVRGSS